MLPSEFFYSLELPTNDHRKDLLRKTDLRELQTYEEETPRKEEKGA